MKKHYTKSYMKFSAFMDKKRERNNIERRVMKPVIAMQSSCCAMAYKNKYYKYSQSKN